MLLFCVLEESIQWCKSFLGYIHNSFFFFIVSLPLKGIAVLQILKNVATSLEASNRTWQNHLKDFPMLECSQENEDRLLFVQFHLPILRNTTLFETNEAKSFGAFERCCQFRHGFRKSLFPNSDIRSAICMCVVKDFNVASRDRSKLF